MKFTTVLLYIAIITVFICTNALAEDLKETRTSGTQDSSLTEETNDPFIDSEDVPMEADGSENLSEDFLGDAEDIRVDALTKEETYDGLSEETPEETPEESPLKTPSPERQTPYTEGSTVLPVPFKIHAGEEALADTTEVRRVIMESLAISLKRGGKDEHRIEVKGLNALRERYDAEGEAAFGFDNAIETARKEGVEFMLIGAITALGKSINLAWRIVDVKDGSIAAFHNLTERSVEELSSKLNSLGAVMREEIVAAVNKRPVLREGTIREVLIEGNKRIGTSAITKKLLSRVGNDLSTDDLREDIHTIYDMGYFSDVVVKLIDRADGKVLIFEVTEKPFISSVSFDGNKDVKDEPIEEVLTVKTSTLIDHAIIKEDAERIRVLYVQKGYYMASITPRISLEGHGASVTFMIDEGSQVKVRSIVITGNDAFSRRKIRKFMATKKAGLFTFITNSGSFDEYVFENDLDVLIDKYYNNGYVESKIVDKRVLLNEDKRWFDITIKIEEGKQYRLDKIEITGNTALFTEKKLLKTLSMKKGRVFSRSELTKGLDDLRYLYGDEGFAYADLRTSTNLNPEAKTINLTVNIEKGEPVYIERIDFRGNTRTRDKVIRRELELGEGDLYSATKLKHSRNNLRRLGYFSDMRINKSVGTTPNKMKLDIDVKERPTGAVTFGLGYSSVDKMTTTASISQSNLLGTGLKLNASGNVSSNSSRYVIGFTEPWLFEKPISAGFDLYKTTKDYTDFSMDTNGFALRLGFPLYKRTTRGYLSYRYEEVTIDNISPTATLTIQEQAGAGKLSSVKALIHHDSRDDFFFPSEGSVVRLSTEMAGGVLGGTNSYLKHELSMKRLFPLAKYWTFSLKGSAGYMHGFDNKEVPLYERYYLGGINTIRGLEARSVSPKDPVTGELIGGLSNALFSAELIFPFFPEEKMMGVIFYDQGNSYEKDISLNDMRNSAGGGLRWFSPMGPLRLEWGYNLDKRFGERESLWEFTIGGLF